MSDSDDDDSDEFPAVSPKHGISDWPRALNRQERLVEVAGMLARRVRPEDIFRAMQAEHSLSPTQARKLLTDVYQRARAKNEEELEQQLQDAFHELEEQKLIARAAGAHTAAGKAIREKHTLRRLYAPKRVEVSGQVTVGVQVQISAMIAVLDDQDLIDLARINAKIEQAKASGALPAVTDALGLPNVELEDADDAPDGDPRRRRPH